MLQDLGIPVELWVLQRVTVEERNFGLLGRDRLELRVLVLGALLRFLLKFEKAQL